MPAGNFTLTVAPMEDFPGVEEYSQYLAGLLARNIRELNWLTGNLDSLNIKELTASKIKTGTLLAALVTIKGDLNSGGYITIDSNGMTVHNGTKVVMRIDMNGNITVEDGTITGGTVRTAASGARIEMSSNTLKTYESGGTLQGLAWGNGLGSALFGDVGFYHQGTRYAEMYDNGTGFRLKGLPASSGLGIGDASVPTSAIGTWNFSNYTGILKGNGSSAMTAISGYTGSFSVVTGVNFTTQTTTTKTVTVNSGVITSVV